MRDPVAIRFTKYELVGGTFDDKLWLFGLGGFAGIEA